MLETLFTNASIDREDSTERETADALRSAVERIQKDLDESFNTKLRDLLPAFELFGYPGLSDPGLVTETTLDVERLLSNHTKVLYPGADDIRLPESYNGLGIRNLVYILLQILGFFRSFRARPVTAGAHLVFIEEPEAHLHPQMQEVFIRQLERIVNAFESRLNDRRPWPVQFVVTTHSPHMANEARFESIRYFFGVKDRHSGLRETRVRDLRAGLGGSPQADRDFLHQYLTLTRCDLFFADKAILVEGTSERLLLPRMIQKVDADPGMTTPLASQYLTVMEVGGAYAHRFFNLVDYLDLPTLVITDLDAVEVPGGRACTVSEGTSTSNSCIKAWFGAGVSPAALVAKSPGDKIVGRRRLAYQVPEADGAPCGRTFEDTFMLANRGLFPIRENSSPAAEKEVQELASSLKKSAFALEYGIDRSDWTVPRYIAEGLQWLAMSSCEAMEGHG